MKLSERRRRKSGKNNEHIKWILSRCFFYSWGRRWDNFPFPNKKKLFSFFSSNERLQLKITFLPRNKRVDGVESFLLRFISQLSVGCLMMRTQFTIVHTPWICKTCYDIQNDRYRRQKRKQRCHCAKKCHFIRCCAVFFFVLHIYLYFEFNARNSHCCGKCDVL